ncbi:stalk domain-containing protein [Desulfofalx alkaliphila]|uniref:stalk domain-containing protein n=1 Tax=Desulfofalx alkaliphila TaxID=105483 RepID=UPI00068DAA00|nr:copper amine oxidase N-terminal domain-containing protein [Desulfofalx alkaliphila]
MKRLLAFTVCLALFVLLVPGMRAVAAQQEQVDVYEQKQLVKSVVFVVGQDRYFIDNKVPGIKMDAAPFIEQGRTFVPIRFLSNALGVENENIAWESPRVTLSEPGFPVVELAVGQKQIKSDGKVTKTDVAPLLRNGRTFLPARFVAEALGYTVEWDAQNNIVLAYPKGQPKPDYSEVVDYIGGEQPPVKEEPETPVGSAEELYDKAKPLEGKPFSFADWNFAPEVQKSLQDKWDWLNTTNPVIQEVTVADLKPNGIEIAGKDGHRGDIIHDLKVTPDGVTVTASNPGKSMPKFYLVEEGKVVRYRGGGGYMGTVTGTLTAPVDHIRAGTPDGMAFLPPADLTKVTHIMFELGDELLLVQNPLYKGGN